MERVVAVRAVASGPVQGVGFRAFVEREARASGVHGWVRNRRDGAVEMHLEGVATRVEGLLDAVRRGPALARVTSLDRRDVAVVACTAFERVADA